LKFCALLTKFGSTAMTAADMIIFTEFVPP